MGAIHRAFDDHPFLLPFTIYVVFAAVVYWLQGPEPPLSLDHIPYIKLADDIQHEFPNGDYWRAFNSVRAYGVILAYLYHITGSHILSLKMLLGLMTIAYLASFQLLMGLATRSRARAVVFSLLSALFVSFGASIWGMTDFAASLNRTLVIPPVVVAVWFFLRYFHSPWRYVVFPAMIVLSLLHLSALHVFGVFLGFEILDYVFRRRFRIDRNLAWFAIAIVTSVGAQAVIETFAAGTTSFIRYTLNMALPAEVVAKMPSLPPMASDLQYKKKPPPPAITTFSLTKEQKEKLTSKEAWAIELMAFPWRNFPPSVATLATIASSYGLIFLLALWGLARAVGRGGFNGLDRRMLTFAGGTVMAAYGLQILLWAIRDRVRVFPINFEEIRAINMIMIPSVYFVYRLYELAPSPRGLPAAATRIAVVAAFALQPIIVVRALPAPVREELIRDAISMGVLRSSDAPRMLYARQFLGLASDKRRFYYSSRGALDWLEHHARPNDVVLTNLDEAYMEPIKTVGPFLGIVRLDVWDPRREDWAQSLDAIDKALAAKDLDRVLLLAREMGATYAIVNWPVPGAAYRDRYYSVVEVPYGPGPNE